jgi:hypothetical protein
VPNANNTNKALNYMMLRLLVHEAVLNTIQVQAMAFWATTLCGMAGDEKRCGGACCLHSFSGKK